MGIRLIHPVKKAVAVWRKPEVGSTVSVFSRFCYYLHPMSFTYEAAVMKYS